ncbi:hypothetical protein DR62_06360 [Burkholderia thailandensis]|nr:hypothetical protein DR62_06360 [Burkholderia thailandensis]AOI52635.1 hypothetical protein WI24_13085 [Burkholderia thailandensis]AOJ51634.1 hypothetical protein AQ475_13000 [Burkholderia thailandensis]AOJ56073.1 hypothetical protein AQ477_05745 [Burkholderia thailandensis]AVR23976.1 hypothetical protein A8H32_01510 [Burkholderia thailandensis]
MSAFRAALVASRERRDRAAKRLPRVSRPFLRLVASARRARARTTRIRPCPRESAHAPFI